MRCPLAAKGVWIRWTGLRRGHFVLKVGNFLSAIGLLVKIAGSLTVELDDMDVIVARLSREQLAAEDEDRVARCPDDL